MNEFKVEISQRAFTSIQEHVAFLARVSLEAAKTLYEETMSSLRSLSRIPERNPEIQQLQIGESRVRKMTIGRGRYAVLYRIKGDQVVIYDVIDTRKDGILNHL